MARQEGVLPIRGTIGNLSFYHDRIHGYLVRRKGGASKEKIRNAPSFQRTRENNSEFGAAQRAGKLIRTAARTYLAMPQDSTIARRLAQRLLQIKDLDAISARGSRNVTNGLQTAEGRELLSTVAFHSGYLLQDVLKKPVVFDANSGTFSISDLTPKADLKAPEAATHVRVQCATVAFDFVNEHFTGRKTPATELVLDGTPVNLILTAEEDNGGETGIVYLGFVSVVFLQEQNGKLYVLREGSSLGILTH